MNKAAIIYHYLAHYRLPIFSELSKSPDTDFTFISGETSEKNIKKIDTSLAKSNIIKWKIIKNVWIFNKKFLWQKGLLSKNFLSNYNAYVFLGSPYFVSTWVAILLLKVRRKKIFFWMHGVYREKLKFIDYIKLYIFYKLADGYFLYGNRAAKILLDHNIATADNIHVVYNSLNYEESFKLRKIITQGDVVTFRSNYFDNNQLPIICFIGRLNFVKRIDMLITAQSILKQKYGRSLFNTIIIGDGEQLSNLKRLTEEEHLQNNISFVGAMYDEKKISDILIHSDLCLTPGEIGLTAIHALSYGTPVITHDNFDIQMPEAEVIRNNFNGALFNHGDIDHLAKTIDSWLSKFPYKDQQIMNNCYYFIDKYYNPQYQATIFNNVLKNIL